MLSELKIALDAIVAFIRSPRLAVTISAVCASMLFLPVNFLSTLGVASLQTEFRHLWGLGFLASGLYVLVLVGELTYSRIAVLKSTREAEIEANAKAEALDKKRQELIDSLTRDELRYLREFIVENKAAIHYDPTDGIAARLRKANILQVYVQAYDVTVGVPHSITPWAKEALEHRSQELAELEPYQSQRSGFIGRY